MLHGVVDSLCQADEDVRIKIGIDIQPFDKPLHKVLNLSNATWIRRQLQYFFSRCDGDPNSFFSMTDNTLRPKTCNTVSDRAIQTCIVQSRLLAA